MAEAKAVAVASTLLSFGGPVGALMGGVLGGMLGKDKIPDTVPLEYATDATDLDAKDVKRYVKAQIGSTNRVIEAQIDEIARRGEYIQQQAREMSMANEMRMVKARLESEKQTATNTSTRVTSQQMPIYMKVDVTEQLIPALVSNIAPTSAPSVAPSNVPTTVGAISSAGFNYWPYVIGGALILSMLLTTKKGKS